MKINPITITLIIDYLREDKEIIDLKTYLLKNLKVTIQEIHQQKEIIKKI